MTGFSERLSEARPALTRSEADVAVYLAKNRETALHASAAEIAAAAGTSDATVIRAVRRLGFAGLGELRAELAADLRRDLTLSDRLANDLARGGEGNLLSEVTSGLRASLAAIDALEQREVDAVALAMAQAVAQEGRIHVFGIGPSGFIAGYFAAQLARVGADSRAVTRTGLQLADDLVGLRKGDMVFALAYDRPYREVRALFDRSLALDLPTVLVTSLGASPPDSRAGQIFRIPRGHAEGFGLHAGTLALLEGFLMAYCARNPERVRAALEDLNGARQQLAGTGLDLTR